MLVARGVGMVLAAVLVVGLSSSISAEPEPRIVEVRVVGNDFTEARLIRSLLGAEAGRPFSPEEIRQGIRRLYARGLLEDIRVEGFQREDGVVLTVHVVEKRRLERVVFKDNDKISRDDLEKETEQPHAARVSERAIYYDVRKIEALYGKKGYRQASVEVEISEVGEGRWVVTYRIREGEKTRVREVKIDGNKALSDKEVRSVLKTRKRRLFRGGDFKEDEFEEDIGRIEDLYGEHGYLDAEVANYRLDYDEEQKNLTVVIVVDEGDLFHVGHVSVEGDTLFGDARILALLGLETGEVLDRTAYRMGLDAIYGAYSEAGYVYCRVVPAEERDGNRVDLDIQIDQGVQAHIGRIEISGNYFTREKVVRRDLVVRPGDVFRRSALMRSQREVFSLGFFEDVQLTPMAGSGEGEMDLLFTVEERQTGQAMMGAGYSNQYGMTGSVQLAKQNFRGTGQTIDIMWEFGRLGQFRIGFNEPWLFDTPTSLGVQLYHTRRRRRGDAFAEEAAGASINIGRPFPWLDYTRIYGRTRLEQWDIQAFSDASATVKALAGTGKTASVRLMLIRNSTDSPFFPTLGSISTLGYEVAGVWRQSEGGSLFQPYSKVELGMQWFKSVVGPFVLAVQSRSGFLRGHSALEEVPIYEKFRLGGTMRDGLRGYSDFEIVPEGNQRDNGGKVMTILKTELKFPIGGPQFFGLFFLDAGNTWNCVAEAQPSTLKKGAGFGVRFEAPMIGTIGLDYGYGFDKDEMFGGPGWEWHFQLGAVQF
ncbi:MAG: outer membrane protein assembly factor BamA [Candidatus Eisenbacteria sp.]|nr:outer membrane protein assembly factor BamA [Candidatus Eisenbacteria bacterium]